MEKYSISIVFDHRRRTEKGKDGPVEVRIMYARKYYYINTGVRVKESEWAGAVTGKRQDKDALNDRLGFIVRRVNEEINKMQADREPFKVDVLRDRVFADERDKNRVKFIEWIENEIPKLSIKSGTMRRYDCLLKRIKEYKRLNEWEDLTTANLYKFDRWLHERKKPQSNGDRQAGKDAEYIGDSGVHNYHKTLRSLLSRAVRLGMIDTNPYEKLKGEFKNGNKENVEYLTDDELEAVESLHPIEGTQSAMARDLFIFQAYTGLSYSDAQSFDIRDYKKVKGQWVAVAARIKTGVPYVSMLLPQAVEVLERYGWQVPHINNAQYNLQLKVIQQALGIRTRLHSHLARHTFATRMLSMGAKIENVSRMLGHTNITQTQRYAKVLAKDVYDDFEKISKKLK